MDHDAPATQLWLERAQLKGFELADEELTSQHVLLALLDGSDVRRTPASLAKRGLDADAVRERVIAMTEEASNLPEPPASAAAAGPSAKTDSSPA